MSNLNVTAVNFDNQTITGTPDELKYQLCHMVDQLANVQGALFFGNVLAYDPSTNMMQHAASPIASKSLSALSIL